MDVLMIYFLCVAGFFLLCSVTIIVAYIFSGYRPNEAQIKAMKEEYERKKEEKSMRKRMKRLSKIPYEGSMDKYMYP